MHNHNVVRCGISTFVLLAQLLQEASITSISCFLCVSLVLLRVLLMKLVLGKLKHLLKVFEALLESLCATWDPTSHGATEPSRSLL